MRSSSSGACFSRTHHKGDLAGPAFDNVATIMGMVESRVIKTQNVLRKLMIERNARIE